MKNWLEYSNGLLRLGKEIGSVFSLMELSPVFNECSKAALHGVINKFIDAGILKQYCQKRNCSVCT